MEYEIKKSLILRIEYEKIECLDKREYLSSDYERHINLLSDIENEIKRLKRLENGTKN